MKAWQLLAPRSVSQFLRSRQYAEEGLRTQGGAEIMLPHKLTDVELAGQAAGFTPTAVRHARERQTGHQVLADQGSRQRQVMLRKVAKAYETKNPEELSAALKAIIDHDKSVPIEDQIGFEGVQDYIQNRMKPALVREVQELPARKRMKWLQQQNEFPGFEPLPSPPR
jgi:hypothetical protein